MQEKCSFVNQKSNPHPHNEAMFIRIDGYDCLITQHTCYVSAYDIGVSPEDGRAASVPKEFVLIYSDGSLLCDSSCERVRALLWVPIYWADHTFNDEFYLTLHASILSFSRFSDTYRVLQIITPIRCIFQLNLYDKFAVSSEGILYLSHSQIRSMWRPESLRESLNLGSDNDSDLSLSHALSTAIGNYCNSLESRKEKAQARYQLYDRAALHELYRNAERENSKRVAFYPYHTLRAIGLPAITELEDAINNGICGLKQ